MPTTIGAATGLLAGGILSAFLGLVVLAVLLVLLPLFVWRIKVHSKRSAILHEKAIAELAAMRKVLEAAAPPPADTKPGPRPTSLEPEKPPKFTVSGVHPKTRKPITGTVRASTAAEAESIAASKGYVEPRAKPLHA